MENYACFVGIDVSKAKLDVTLLLSPIIPDLPQQHFIVSNDKKGIGQIFKELVRKKIELSTVLFCFEDTGVYSMPLSCFLSDQRLDYWMVPAIEIKRSKGISRGKSDKADARDIAFYAATHLHKLKLSSIAPENLLKLKILFTERQKVLKALTILESTLESAGFVSKNVMISVTKINAASIRQLKKSLQLLDKEMQDIIASDDVLSRQNELIQSLPGLGPMTTTYLIIVTKAFQSFDNWRQLACYAGVAPFEYSSGSSIKGRTKVHPMADKKLKSLLNMCAMNAKKYDTEMKLYFERKVAEGKNKMLVLNSIRCKLLARIFAIIKRNSPYVDVLKFAA